MTSINKAGRPAHDDILTPSEWKVVEGVRHGLTNPQIANRQGVSLNAVKFHVANILAKLGLENRTDIRLWDGIRADSQLSSKEVIMSNTGFQMIGQVARHVTNVMKATENVMKATEWFRDILGLKHLYSFGDLSFFDCAGTRLFLSKGDPEMNSILYFAVIDIHRTHSELVGQNVEIVSAPHMIHQHEDGTEEWMAFFNDMDGQPLGIMSRTGKGKDSDA